QKGDRHPTGMVLPMAKAGGFTSVSDMIHEKGAQNICNYKRVKEICASPGKLIIELLEQNARALDQISTNFDSFKIGRLRRRLRNMMTLIFVFMLHTSSYYLRECKRQDVECVKIDEEFQQFRRRQKAGECLKHMIALNLNGLRWI
nr:zinc-finger domain of monoamine-oxidase A repressor R1 [Tanacetum cinerariifolium]